MRLNGKDLLFFTLAAFGVGVAALALIIETVGNCPGGA